MSDAKDTVVIGATETQPTPAPSADDDVPSVAAVKTLTVDEALDAQDAADDDKIDLDGWVTESDDRRTSTLRLEFPVKVKVKEGASDKIEEVAELVFRRPNRADMRAASAGVTVDPANGKVNDGEAMGMIDVLVDRLCLLDDTTAAVVLDRMDAADLMRATEVIGNFIWPGPSTPKG